MRLFFPSNQPSPFYNVSLPDLYSPPPQGVAMEKEEKEKGDITAKNGRRKKERLDNEINLPSSLPYRRKHFSKLDVRLFSEELEAYANRYFCDTY